MITYREIKPAKPLSKYIKCYWFITAHNEIPSPVKDRILPDGCIDILFNMGTPFVYEDVPEPAKTSAKSVIVGTMKQSLIVGLVGKINVAGIRIKPGGAFPFLSIPAYELTDSSLIFSEIQHQLARDIEQCIYESKKTDEITSRLDRLFIRHLNQTHDIDHSVMNAVEAVFSHYGNIRLHSLEHVTGISCRQLERKFKQHIGLSPKMFSRIIRFNHVMSMIRKRPDMKWTDIAYHFGYFDQAHFIKEIKALSGLTPAEYLAEQKGVGFLQYNSNGK